MKNLFYLIVVATLSILVSCNNADDITESVTEVKRYTPTVNGVLGSFADENPSVRAGIVEDNPDYATAGESFYWHDGDQVLLVFIDNATDERTEVTYTASVGTDVVSNVAEFATTETVPEGTYTVYGLHPAAGWTWDDTQSNYVAEMATPAAIADSSSEYLGRNLFMKAKAENVVIGDAGDNNIDLSYQHLGGVIRFHLRNPFDENFPRIREISLDKVDTSNEDSLLAYFTTTARLVNLDDEFLTPTDSIARVSIQFAENVSALDFDFYLPILPVEGFVTGEALRIEALIDGINTPQSLFSSDASAPFLVDGFNAGSSYYIRLTNWGSAFQ